MDGEHIGETRDDAPRWSYETWNANGGGKSENPTWLCYPPFVVHIDDRR